MKIHLSRLIKLLYTFESFIFKTGAFGRILVSAARSIAHGKIQHFYIDKDGDYVNSQRSGVVVSPVPLRSNFRKVCLRVRNSWLVDYMIQPGDIVFDIGAGIGEETVVFARYVGTNGRVFSFEANPRTARCLAKTVRMNELDCVEIIVAAVMERSGRIMMTNDVAHDQSSLFVTKGQSAVEVQAITLDEFVESKAIHHIDLLKMNIEGAEKPALLGFQRNFGCVRNVAIDCHDWIADLGHSESYRTLEFVHNFLESQGFIVHRRANYQITGLRPKK